MARLVFLLVVFALIVVLVFYLVKAFKMDHKVEEQSKESGTSMADELLKLQALKDKGIISEAEFEEMKKKILEK
ncbi:MAG: SHOCT domain-containing protein [Bacteroidales bacterium]|nr:SHOCT domain-containing protein [Bacteroidales bacterium]